MRLSSFLLFVSIAMTTACEAERTDDPTDAGADGSADASADTPTGTEPVSCEALCRRSLGCANDSRCPEECRAFRATCNAEADAMIRCVLSRSASDLECNAQTGTTQVRRGVCSAEQNAYITCYGASRDR
jgi:hypothetical protein